MKTIDLLVPENLTKKKKRKRKKADGLIGRGKMIGYHRKRKKGW